jgi:hypothetical protein
MSERDLLISVGADLGDLRRGFAQAQQIVRAFARDMERASAIEIDLPTIDMPEIDRAAFRRLGVDAGGSSGRGSSARSRPRGSPCRRRASTPRSSARPRRPRRPPRAPPATRWPWGSPTGRGAAALTCPGLPLHVERAGDRQRRGRDRR